MIFNDFYAGKKVLVTGHTGFKGSWLTAWLVRLGAEVCGIALDVPTEPAHWSLLNLPVRSEICDIRDREKVRRIFAEFQPEMVFHLAAQPLVRLSYSVPVETFDVNVMGTVNVLDICRQTPSVRSAVVVTSDKCYENLERPQGYTESDAMGGYDPYSASKGCAELVTAAYRRSFFHPDDYGTKHGTLIASARAGNVIGGGDWALDRLVPDIMKAAAKKVPARIRNPKATRPWQHVLEPLRGYLLLGMELFNGRSGFAGAWNFGPSHDGVICVGEAAKMLKAAWNTVEFTIDEVPDSPHEATLLHLNCTKAEKELNWHGVLAPAEMFELTAGWYREFYSGNRVITVGQIAEYESLAEERNPVWTE